MTNSGIDPIGRRIRDLDTIAAVLPMERRDELAGLLTDQDVKTLRIWSMKAWRKYASGPDIGSRLPAGMVAGRDRRSPALAGA